jgi:translation initiation factor 2 beta subunit (eIF-2beta)/eIF-5
VGLEPSSNSLKENPQKISSDRESGHKQEHVLEVLIGEFMATGGPNSTGRLLLVVPCF